MADILIDMQACQTESRFRGLGRYTDALAQAIAAQAGQDEIHLLLNSSFPETLGAIRRTFDGLVRPQNIHVVELLDLCEDRSPRLRWRHHASALMREAYIEMIAPDVVFCPSFFEGYIDSAVLSIGRLSSVPVVTTVHDFIPLIYRQDYLDNNADFKRHYLAKLEELKKSAGIITISESSFSEAMDLLGISPDVLVNASEAGDPKFRRLELSTADREAVRRRFGLEKPFVFYTGGSDPRKNLPRLVEAFARLPVELRERHQLVLAGSMPELDRTGLQDEARRRALPRDALKFLGYVNDDDLIRLYNLAELFVFPSLHEGFGLPCLEAFQCGTPVLGANASSLPEVIGNPEALFDPLSAGDMAAKMQAVLADAGLRARLAAEGAEQAARYSWERSGRLALAAIRKAAAAPKAPENWAGTRARIETCQQRLVEAVAKMPPQPAKPDEQDLMQVAQAMVRNRTAAEARLRTASLARPVEWRLEGPFDSSYSLAVVNRALARALAAEGERVSLLSAEGPGEFAPDEAFLAANPDLARLHACSSTPEAIGAEVVSRNMYPPRVVDMQARVNGLHNYAWEETGFPSDYAEAFNESLQFITATSRHVQRVLVDGGVSVPISVVGNGVDHWMRIEPDPAYRARTAGYTFLHVSSCFPRKGADVLLESYGRAFTNKDDVLLVIKTFRNPHNRIEEMLAQHRAANPAYPDVLLLMDDVGEAQLKALYGQCDALVAPSRAEGFGLPIAEAMLSGLHVIATGWSGQMDFCNAANADLIDFSFARADTHEPDKPDSVWAEPDAEHLAALMAQAFRRKAGIPRLPVPQGLLAEYGWTEVARRNVAAAARASEAPYLADPRVGWVSTYNKRCGIATYSQHLIDVLGLPTVILAGHADEKLGKDGDNVVRCWHEGKVDDFAAVLAAVEHWKLDVVVVQFNYGFYDFECLAAFLHRLVDAGKTVVVTLHATIDPAHEPHRKLEMLVPALARCDRLLVHSVNDMNRLKRHGLVENVSLFPHGVLAPKAPAAATRSAKGRNRPVTVASYGFFLPNKGLLELIEAVHLLRGRGLDFRLRLVNAEFPAEVSYRLIQQAKALIARHRLWSYVDLRTDFLSDEDSLALLSSADLVAYTYQETAESASGAVRYGLAAGKPVVVTPLPIFQDLDDCVFKLPGTSPAQIAQGLEALASDAAAGAPDFVERLARARNWRDSHAYPVLGRRLAGMLKGLARDRTKPSGPAG
ncbi:D-inositol-3-phosphate glycosyltransferase [Aquamicrobium terrae]